MPDDTALLGHREEECWACNGYGVVHGPLGAGGTRRRWRCPWCRGTGVLYDGSHEHGETCECHLGVDFVPGDHYARLVSHELPEPIWERYCAATGRDPDSGAPAS